MPEPDALGPMRDQTRRERPSPDAAANARAAPPERRPINGLDPLPAGQKPNVDIVLRTSSAAPVVGELWSVSGEIRNHSRVPIWIVDFTTVLSLAPEMFGRTADYMAQSATFPTTRRVPNDEVVKIDAGASYTAIWELGKRWRAGRSDVPLREHVSSSIRDYIFFNPGRYRISSTVHIWTKPPTFPENGVPEKGRVANLEESFPITVEKEIDVEPSPWVLILGASIGGLLCFIIQMLYGGIPVSGSVVDIMKNIVFGLLSSILLPAIVTILLSRLAHTDFLIAIKVRDLWGALATGFTAQWIGYGLLTKLIGSLGS